MKTEPLRLIRTTTYVTLVVTCLALCVPYALHGEWIWALAALWLFAIAVPVPDLPPWGRVVSNVTFAGSVILAGNAAARLGGTMWALIAVTAATATWDLQHLIHRLPASEPAASEPATSVLATSVLAEPADAGDWDRAHQNALHLARSAPPNEQTDNEEHTGAPSPGAVLVRAHLQRLGLTLGLSLVFGALALVIHVNYSLRTLALLILILIVGLTGAVAYVRRRSD